MPRNEGLVDAFVDLADTLVADFDVVDFLQLLAARCVELLDADAAGLMLADPRGQLQVVATSSERARDLELFELETDEGPCVACFRSGMPADDTDLVQGDPRWPRFGNRARQAGFRAVHALPMRLRAEVIGVLNLFYTSAGAMNAEDLRVGQALADIATIGLLQERAIRDRQILAEQLQTALDSRVLIEQAKGVLSERLQIGTDTAFVALREQARATNRLLTDLAREVVAGTVDSAAARRRPPPGTAQTPQE
jgi:transcriptional regulator with GAF, ATPase, and Fis domain